MSVQKILPEAVAVANKYVNNIANSANKEASNFSQYALKAANKADEFVSSTSSKTNINHVGAEERFEEILFYAPSKALAMDLSALKTLEYFKNKKF